MPCSNFSRWLGAAWLAAAASLFAASATAEESGGEPVEEVIEVLEDFEMISTEDIKQPSKPAQLLGQLHIPIVHLPIGWLILTLLMALARQKWPHKVGEADRYMLWLTLLICLPTLGTGWMHGENMEAESEMAQLMERHENLAWITSGVIAVAAIIRQLAFKRASEKLVRVSLVIVLIASALIGLVGHLGGTMVYGEDFLALPF